jgi:hypothetical protein
MGVATLTTDPETVAHPAPKAASKGISKSRFTKCITVGWILASVPYLYVLWGLWGKINVFRSVSPAGFYDLQAQAIVKGTLALKKNSLGIEAFYHNGHTYTYFGIFPSLIRLPVLALDPALQGKLTAPSMLLAWLVTAFFSSLLIWRLRVMVRGDAVMGWLEAVSYGILVLTICAGSVLIYLAANPWVYDEDLAWSVALCTAAIFMLLGVLESPSWRRIVLSSIFILMTDLNRSTTGWACVITGFLVAGWFAFGRAYPGRRQWALPMAGAALVPLMIGGIVTSLKFGGPFSLPLADQKWSMVNAYRRYFLAQNGGKGYGVQFVPTDLWTYLQPFGLRLSTIFPFITIPNAPPQIFGNVVFDQWTSTTSITASMPLLTLLSAWGTVAAFWPRSTGNIRLNRPLLLGAATATGGVVLWGYIANRYLADFMPFLILGAAIGLVDLWRRAAVRAANNSAPTVRRRSLTPRRWLFGAVVVLGVFGLFANTAAALGSIVQWSSPQALQFVEAQNDLSFTSLAATLKRGSTLPYWAPTGELFDVDNCSGLYISNGVQYYTIPGQNLQHIVWTPIAEAPGEIHRIEFTLSQPIGDFNNNIPIFQWGQAVVTLEPVQNNEARIAIVNPSPAPSWPVAVGPPIKFHVGKHYVVSIETDPYLQSLRVRYSSVGRSTLEHISKLPLDSGVQVVYRYEAGNPPQKVVASSQPGITFRELSSPDQSEGLGLCRSLQSGK